MTPGRAAIVLRSPASVAVFAAVALLCAALLVDALLRARGAVALVSLPAVTLVLWSAWLVFARPCLRLSGTGLTIVNVLRTTTVPWGAVDEIVLRHQVVVVTRSGERLRCWGAPSSARSSMPVRSSGPAPRAAQVREPSGRISGSAAHRAIQGYWERHERPQGPTDAAARRWNGWSLQVGVALLLVVVAQLIWAAQV
ncbi:hypothetical protein E3T26_02945 [Cryobacterium sp. TMT1-21]|uniref:Low molecular weight protein antigen 6 PH domain-containing protein n=1 Tax=Cryobacterium shii TaxID=1259235 RepID=A0AAQ2C7T1_9MICO|nr:MULTISPECIES: PH domain-containing protein [Cryobacterium]TFC51232.1 hypothetical protein E3O49_03925 [Cryobacterium shii]TFC85256.1 hypothetical protein E3T24_09015 [Cryobacterium sp. TmT2-59]TFD15795.1 hypothetical protein E3T42_09830 [Cryobacterium sp. TMT4-10]TFD17059.1 hypothetical protein E3T26_02945 [Cryobacterium sp. TMT1-21]TFD41440.1 hypothetical protein E3T37_04195 [Cryobacterium sp. TMT2-10]